MCLAASPNCKLTNAIERISHRRGRQCRTGFHRREPLIDVVMPNQEDVHTGCIARVPERLERLVICRSRTVARLMPDCDHVFVHIRGEVSFEPRFLRRANVTASGHKLAFAIKVNYMPVTTGDIVTVVAVAPGIGRVGAIVAEVTVEVIGYACPPIVIARHRARARLNR